MRTAVDQAREYAVLAPVGPVDGLLGEKMRRERCRVGLLDAGAKRSRDKIENAAGLDRIVDRAAAGIRESRTEMQGIQQSQQNEQRKQHRGRHADPALRDPAPALAQMLMPADMPRKQPHGADQQEQQGVGPQDHRYKRHQSNLTRGSAIV
jgi:hypothetical protein